jgi:hypothetical protein
MITRLRYPKGYQFFDANGAPLGLGALSYYAAGTTTPQDTYSDSAGAAVNPNPVVLDGSGRLEVDIYLGPTANYKEVLASASATVSPWPDDNIPFATQADWNAPSGPNQILNKPALAAAATSGSYADLSDTPSAFTGDAGTGGTRGLVPAPAAGDALANKFLSAAGAWATPPGAFGSGATDLSITAAPDNVGIGSSSGTGVTIPAATSTAAGVLNAARAAKIDGLAAVATSGSYADLSGKPSIPSIPGSLSGVDIDNAARLGINTTDSSNLLSVNAPSVLFSNAGDMRATISKGSASNIAAFNFQDNFSTRVQFGLLGNDSFTIATSPDGSTFENAVVATASGAVSFPNTGGFTGDSGSGGSTGLVPAPAAGTSAAGKYLKADGTWSVPAATATVMTGATASMAGNTGLAPAPVAGEQGAFLRGDGAWAQMTPAQVSGLAPSATVDTTNATNITSGALPVARLPLFSNSANGAVAASGGGTSNFLRADGTWAAPPAGALTSPVALGSNTLLATPLAGDLEYDAEALYFSPAAGVRGLVPVYQFSRVIAAGGKGLNNDANAQSFLPPGAQNFPVQAGAIYRFHARVLLNTGNSNSRTVSALFAPGGGAAFSWISYSSKAYGSASMGNMNFDWVSVMNAASARTMTSFGSYVWYELQMEGEFVMSSGGTIQPQIQFSAAPGGTNVSMQGTYFELYTYGYNASSVGLT